MSREKRRGRPLKEKDEKKSEHVGIRMRPSRKKILVQEKDRCASTLSEILTQHAYEELEPHGRGPPRATTYDTIPNLAEQLGEIAAEADAEWPSVRATRA